MKDYEGAEYEAEEHRKEREHGAYERVLESLVDDLMRGETIGRRYGYPVDRRDVRGPALQALERPISVISPHIQHPLPRQIRRQLVVLRVQREDAGRGDAVGELAFVIPGQRVYGGLEFFFGHAATKFTLANSPMWALAATS